MILPPVFVLDASALIAYLRREAGFARVIEAMEQGAAVSAVNWAETLSRLSDHGIRMEFVVSELRRQGLLGQALTVWPLDEALAEEVARLRASTRSLGLSLGDRACLALARRLDLPALTADRTWTKLAPGIRVEVIR